MEFTNLRLHIHDERFKLVIAIHRKKSDRYQMCDPGQMQSVCHGFSKSFNTSVVAYCYALLGCFPSFLILLQRGHVSELTG